MNANLIAKLVGLRYKLLWARMRSRNGRIALFAIGWVLFAMLSSALGAGGFGAGLMAIRSGQGQRIAQGALSLLFLQAVLVANTTGFGMNSIFSENELRRYPLISFDRLLARHVIGILDPFWFVYLALYLGLAIGFFVYGSANLPLAVTAVVLLSLSNYVAARVVAQGIDHLSVKRGASEVLVLAGVALVIAMTMAIPMMRAGLGWTSSQWLSSTPTFGAASALVQSSIRGLLVVAGWLLGLVALLLWTERHPPQESKRKVGKVVWDNWYDRAAGLFGPRLGPLVGQWLRYYARNSFVQRSYWLVFPLMAFLTYNVSRGAGSNGLLTAALGTFPCGLFVIGWRMTVNQFGYVGGGFRRYLLFPVRAADILRGASYASVLIKAPALVLGLLAWILFAPVPFDVRVLVMLLCSSIAGVLLLHALSVWITLLSPRRGNYAMKIGNDSSLAGNALVVATTLGAVLLPRLIPVVITPDSWWMLLPLPPLAGVVYFATLAAAGPMFAARREKLLAMTEGKD